MRRLLALGVAVLVLLQAAPAPAANPWEEPDDPALEERARDLSKELRCLVCQNQSIDDSDAELARDLRLIVRERLEAGDTDAEVLAYLTDRYGPFVRLRPPLTATTFLLWVTPFVVVVFALAGGVLYVRGRRQVAADAPRLTDEEEQALARLLETRRER